MLCRIVPTPLKLSEEYVRSDLVADVLHFVGLQNIQNLRKNVRAGSDGSKSRRTPKKCPPSPPSVNLEGVRSFRTPFQQFDQLGDFIWCKRGANLVSNFGEFEINCTGFCTAFRGNVTIYSEKRRFFESLPIRFFYALYRNLAVIPGNYALLR